VLFSRINRAFWGFYGSRVWDSVQTPLKKRMIETAVAILRERRKSVGESVLDAGCGTGNYALALAGEGFRVTGIDYSAGMLECARSKAGGELAARLSFEQMDMNRRLEFPDASFDHIISMTSLWATADPRFTLTEFSRILKPGGTLAVMQIPAPVNNLRLVIRNRFKYLVKKTPLTMALVAFKALLERTGATRYWTQEELLAMILGNRELAVSYVDPGPPFFIVATKK